MEQEIFIWLGKLATWLASIGVLSFYLIKFFGKEFIKTGFAKEIEAFKAKKFHDFDLLLSRKIKWHDKEWEVLETAWAKLVRAEATLSNAIMRFRQFSDLEKMNSVEFQKFLDRSDLSDNEKDYLIKENNNNKANNAYSRILDFRAINESAEALADFTRYLNQNRIFMRSDAKDKFTQARSDIHSAWIGQTMELDYNSHESGHKAMEKLMDKIKPIVQEIESLVMGKLLPEEDSNKS